MIIFPEKFRCTLEHVRIAIHVLIEYLMPYNLLHKTYCITALKCLYHVMIKSVYTILNEVHNEID